jgi:hypothetical protein
MWFVLHLVQLWNAVLNEVSCLLNFCSKFICCLRNCCFFMFDFVNCQYFSSLFENFNSKFPISDFSFTISDWSILTFSVKGFIFYSNPVTCANAQNEDNRTSANICFFSFSILLFESFDLILSFITACCLLSRRSLYQPL